MAGRHAAIQVFIDSPPGARVGIGMPDGISKSRMGWFEHFYLTPDEAEWVGEQLIKKAAEAKLANALKGV